MANHFPGLKHICQKQRLYTTMSDFYYKKFGEVQYKQKLLDLVPKTYRLDDSSDCLAFINDPDQGLYIEKRFFMNRGLGVR